MTPLLHTLNLAVAGYLCGLIWLVQLVHYPLMRHVHPAGWIAFHRAHTRRTTLVVVWAMLAEMALGLWWVMTELTPASTASLSLTLVAWASTFLIQVPLHNKLAGGKEDRAIALLVETNWIRTAAWTLRLVLLVAWGS
jgi:hypothetical protein